MQRRSFVAQDATGKVLPAATVYVYQPNTTTEATVYSDDGVTAITQPITADSLGRFSFFAPSGEYDVAVTYRGNTATVEDVEFIDDTDVGTWFDTDAEILADTTLSYSGANAVTAGQIIPVRREQTVYVVAASGASDHDMTTAGGVKLYLRRNDLQGDFIPDTDGVGTPSTALSAYPVGSIFTVAQAGRMGIGTAAGKLLYPGDVVTVESGALPDLIWALGQSNMQGVSIDAAGGTYIVDPDVKVWNNTVGAFVTADIENETYTTTTGNPFGAGKQNIAVAYAHRRKAQTGKPQYVVLTAQGGLSMTNFVPGQTVYDTGKAVVEAALAALGKTSIDAVIFHQGEADAASDGFWRTLAASFVQGVRAETWCPADTPITFGEACPDWSVTANRDRMNAEVGTMLDIADPYIFVAQSTGLSGDGDIPNNQIHFGNEGLFEMGYNRYWRAMWGKSTDIPVTTAATATTSISVQNALYETRAFARENYVSQKDVLVARNNGAVTIKSLQGSLVLSAEDGSDNVIANGLSMRPLFDGGSDLGTETRAWDNLILKTAVIQPSVAGFLSFYIGMPGTGEERLRIAPTGTFNRSSVLAMQDVSGDGFNVLNFAGSDGSARGEITTSYTAASGAMRLGVKNTSGTMQYVIRLNADGKLRFPLVPGSFTTSELPNLYISPSDQGVSISTATGIGQRVTVPTTATDAGKPGQFAADASYIYVYTGDGTTHTWVRSAAAAW